MTAPAPFEVIVDADEITLRLVGFGSATMKADIAETMAWALEDAVASIRLKMRPPTAPQIVDGASP